MDKQKELNAYEQMAIVCARWFSCGTCPYNPEANKESICPNFDKKLVYAMGKGYRKIHENDVVLRGTETEKRFEDLMVAFDEMGFMPNTTHPFPEEYVETWKQRLIFVFGQLRKETAEKFAERLKDIFKYEAHQQWIDEICKEIIGEV